VDKDVVIDGKTYSADSVLVEETPVEPIEPELPSEARTVLLHRIKGAPTMERLNIGAYSFPMPLDKDMFNVPLDHAEYIRINGNLRFPNQTRRLEAFANINLDELIRQTNIILNHGALDLTTTSLEPEPVMEEEQGVVDIVEQNYAATEVESFSSPSNSKKPSLHQEDEVTT